MGEARATQRADDLGNTRYQADRSMVLSKWSVLSALEDHAHVDPYPDVPDEVNLPPPKVRSESHPRVSSLPHL